MLREALRSIAAATPAGVEVLVVDSGSRTDETRRVAREASVAYVRSDVPGLSIARNLGLAHAERPLVLFTDDDCVAVPGWVDGVLAHFADERVGAVTGRMLDHTLVADAAPGRVERLTGVLRGIDAGHGAFMTFRRELMLGLGGFDEVLGAGRRFAGAEDLDAFCRVLAAGYAIVSDTTATVHHNFTRQDDDHIALYRGYGLGAGAMADKWIRSRPLTGLAMAGLLIGRAALGAVRWPDPRERSARLALLKAIPQGIGAAARVPRRGALFVDADRPAPIAPAGADDAVPEDERPRLTRTERS
ncbi:glycosyltransferase family 2 protein [Gryllotalpicola protaetiae]|uniref:Glycosyltransferase n=1 Tax=Gryllotalpicola protaetiae TaxID=2419771 RepID=A0A387BRL3_9MICO|nr:glycosyltransferase [Gryllotalpicola protaetiae]AYG03710.1 glycosyltransferase [Gryllotalpicola protaetiae]